MSIYHISLDSMPDRSFYMKRVINKIVKNTIKKNPAFKNVRSAEVQFLMKSPVRSAMCDWVYGLKVETYNDDVNQPLIISTLKEKITEVSSQVTNDTFCLTDYYFE
jgi:hypothetical protein